MTTARHSKYDALGGYSWNDQKKGLPKQKAIIEAMSIEELRATRTDVWRASTDRVFGQANKPIQVLIDAEFKARNLK